MIQFLIPSETTSSYDTYRSLVDSLDRWAEDNVLIVPT